MKKNYEEKIDDKDLSDVPSDDAAENSSPEITEEQFKEEYRKLPMWQHVVLVLLFLFGMAAVIVGIDFVVSFFTELLKKIF